jgi:hypothetical protein
MAQARASGSAASFSLASAVTPATPHVGRVMHAWVLASVPALGHATFARSAASRG